MNRIPPHNYIHIEYWMTQLGLKPIETLIYAIIHGFCQDGMSSFRGSQRYFREWTGAARSTVTEALKDLKDKKLIIAKNVRIGNSVYQEYYTVASRTAWQEIAELERNEKRVTENQSYTCPEIGHPLTENQSSSCPKSGHNNIADNKFKKAADSSSEKQNEKYDGAAAALISKKLNELFGSEGIFDSDFVYDLEKVILDKGVGEGNIGPYLDSVFEKTLSKKPLNIPALYRKLATAGDVVQDFILKLPKPEVKAEVRKDECPVCGEMNPVSSCTCSKCGFDRMYLGDIKKIRLEKAVYNLPADRKQKLDSSLEEIYTFGNFMDFMNPVKAKEREEKIKKAYMDVGITYEA